MRFWRKWLGFVRRKSFQTDPRAVPLVPIHILSTIKGAELELSQKFQRVTLNMIPAAYYLGHLHYTTDISFQNEDCVLMQHMNRSVWSKSARSSCVFFADIQYCVLSVVLIAITRHDVIVRFLQTPVNDVWDGEPSGGLESVRLCVTDCEGLFVCPS